MLLLFGYKPYSQAKSISMYHSQGFSGYEASLCADDLESEHGIVTYDDWLNITASPSPTGDLWAVCPVKIIYRGLRVS